MPDTMTVTTSLTYDQTMWNKAIYYPLRPQLYFDMFADVKATDNSPERGAAVTFTKQNDLAAVTAPIDESVDIDAVELSSAQVTLTLAEYANGVNTSFRVRATSFVSIDSIVANAVGFNAGISLDTLARNVMEAGTNVRYAGAATTRGTVASTHVLTAANVRRARVDLVNANVADFNGYYASVISADVAYDLRGETGAAAWRDPHTYSQPSEIWSGEIGVFEGFRFMESPRAPMFANTGVGSTVDVYRTLFFGRQAMAKAYSTWEGRGALPIVIIGPVIDRLERFRPVSWHWFGAYGLFRQESLRSVESASSIGAN
jgi:N4-gp56 family major capsid protein